MSSSSPPPQPTGVLLRVDRESLNTLIEKYVTSLTTNASEQERVEKLKQEYVNVRSKLTTLPQQIEYNALVPLGRRAVCPGKIVHTNEIMCLLGDNWFVECSAAKAIEIANHRITKLDEQHESLRKEQELINNWKQEAERQLIETIGYGTVEIKEDYDEEQDKRWRAQHRESVRRYHQQLAKQRLEARQEKRPADDDSIWTRLDELEIQEELEDYLEQEDITKEQATKVANFISEPTPTQTIRSQKAAVDNNKSKSNAGNDNMTSSTTQSRTNSTSKANLDKTDVAASTPRSIPPGGKRRVKFSADNIIHDISDDINYSNQESYNQEKSETPMTEIADDSTMPTYPCFEPIMIRFKHSTVVDVDDDNASGTEEEDQISQIVASPGQIVKVFGPTSISAISNKPLPKSILKPYAPPLVTEEHSKKAQVKERRAKVSFPDGNGQDDDVDLDSITVSAVSKVVTERVPVFTSLQLNDSDTAPQVQTSDGGGGDDENGGKPVSLFKMRRQQQAMRVAVTSPD